LRSYKQILGEVGVFQKRCNFDCILGGRGRHPQALLVSGNETVMLPRSKDRIILSPFVYSNKTCRGDRQTDRQTDGQTDGQTDRQANRQIDRIVVGNTCLALCAVAPKNCKYNVKTEYIYNCYFIDTHIENSEN